MTLRKNESRESAKQRALRIPLLYHRTWDLVKWWKVILAIVAALIAAVYVGWSARGGGTGAMQTSHGPLASVHASWNSDCATCHVPFIPMRSDARGIRTLRGLTTEKVDLQVAVDRKCTHCHSAPPHHANQLAAEVGSCASCHTDHQGRDADIVRPSDAHCTSCHADIAGHIRREEPRDMPGAATEDVSGFPSGEGGRHPKFRSLKHDSDPGNIKFSHRLHMTKGLLYPGMQPQAGKTREFIPTKFRSQYAADIATDGQIQLQCSSCHTAEATSASEVRGAGDYMLPIRYEEHCQACHPLTVAGEGGATVPHGLELADLRQAVTCVISANQTSRKGSQSESLSPARPIPGKTPRDNLADNISPQPDVVLSQRLAELRSSVCAKCHIPVASIAGAYQEVEFARSNLPAVWLQHARFDHRSHRGTACADCHAHAQEKLPRDAAPGKSQDDERVMIPDIENCERCHSPRNERAKSGGARYDCAECHRYHAHEKTSPKSAGEPIKAAGEGKPPIRLVSDLLQPASDNDVVRNSRHAFVGTQNCSASGCHGNTRGTASETAYARFLDGDPHCNAFLILYAEPAIRIFRRFTQQPSGEADERQYFTFLRERCVGCHATERPGSEGGVWGNAPEDYLAGVSCESCHGAAGKWEFTHYREKQTDNDGLVPLADLSRRGGSCVQCHIGPREHCGQTYDMNHDLIAAGHPRLTFELDAYLENLPAHWDRKKDIARHAKATGSSFHFDAWRFGQFQIARQQAELWKRRTDEAEQQGSKAVWPEFASFDCLDCHHSLQASIPRLGRGPRPHIGLADVSLLQLDAILGPGEMAGRGPLEPFIEEARAALTDWSLQGAIEDQSACRRLVEALTKLEARRPNIQSVAERAAILLRILDGIHPADPTKADSSDARWDRLVQFSLALAAFNADFPTQQPRDGELGKLQGRLHNHLQSCFQPIGPEKTGGKNDPFVGGPYDGPNAFDSRSEVLRELLEQARTELTQLAVVRKSHP